MRSRFPEVASNLIRRHLNEDFYVAIPEFQTAEVHRAHIPAARPTATSLAPSRAREERESRFRPGPVFGNDPLSVRAIMRGVQGRSVGDSAEQAMVLPTARLILTP